MGQKFHAYHCADGIFVCAARLAVSALWTPYILDDLSVDRSDYNDNRLSALQKTMSACNGKR